MREDVVDGMRYLEAGAGWPVVLLHAFPVNADMWRPQLASVPQGFRFIAPDLTTLRLSLPPEEGSHGAGIEREAGLERGAGLDEYARAIVRLLDRLEIERAVIGGLSMGGYITFAVFRLAPERFSGAILADTRPQADSDEAKGNRARMRQVVARKGAAAIADEMLPKLLSREAAAEVVAFVRRTIEVVPATAIDAALAAMMARPDSTADLARMSIPTLVVVGEHDEVTPPAEAERMQARLPRARLAVIPGAGHLANVERPHEFSHALHDFLVAPM